ncbi:MAG: ATP-binding protein [Aminipila sp.]
MLHKLRYILTIMIVLSLIFVGCLICYVSANTQLVNYEESVGSLLTFNSTYEKAFNELIVEAKSYISTGDPATKYKITNSANNLTSYNGINISHIRFSNSNELSGFEFLSDYDGSSPKRAASFSLNTKEQLLLYSYLNCSESLISSIINAVNEKDLGLLYSQDFIDTSEKRDGIRSQYTLQYSNRIEGKTIELQAFLEVLTILSIFVGTALILCVIKSVSIYLKNNQYNAYFNQLYSKAIENADVGMAIVDKHYKYEYMNATYKQLLNIQTLNPIGQTSFAVLPEEIAATLPSHSFSENQKDIILSYTHEGEIRYINYNCFAIFDEKDEPKFVSLIQDCTQSHKKDAELKQQLKEIEYFANAKASFIANVSHEIKTPLNVIIGMVHILKGTELTTKQHDVLSKIHISSELLLNIINDVLDISKIQKSNFVLYPSEFNLLEMLKESEEIFAPIICNKGLEYIKDFNFSPQLYLSLDKTRLAQVLLNLVNNACKFTSAGHIRLSVNQIDRQGDSALLRFTVEDTGLGIDESDVSKVFQEFEQLENHLTKQHQGTGLGLAICKHVVNAMGGDIWVESKKSVGSKFNFTIWARIAEPSNYGINKELPTGNITLNGNGRRILVVEDTELNYEVTENMLSESNIICEHACDGQEAIDMCIKVPEDYYTVILMDIHMPNMDGYTAAEILKTEIGITCPIIALTATNIDVDTKKKYKNIMDDFIGKPFRYQDFYRVLYPYFGSLLVEKNTCSGGGAKDNQSSDIPTSPDQVDNSDSSNTTDSNPDPENSTNTESSEETETKDSSSHTLSEKKRTVCSTNRITPPNSINSTFSLSEAARNLGCSEKQYIKHLTKFKTAYAHVDTDIQELLIDKNYTEAHRIAHSVKGLAGTLGLYALQQTAAELEFALKEESAKAATILTLFKDELAGVCTNSSDYN